MAEKPFAYCRNPSRIVEGCDMTKIVSGLHDLCAFLKSKGLSDRMVEVGTAYGESAAIFAQYFGEVWCIDEWKLCDPGLPDPEKAFDEFRATTLALYKIKRNSLVAAKEFIMTFDFVYVDANHRYENVYADIEAWAPRVRSGGYLGGHDYDNPYCPGVKVAVDQLFGSPLRVFDDMSWVVKP